MKIEIGESLLQSYLKNVKNCVLSQTNWKTAASWKIEQTDFEKTEYVFNKIQKHEDFSDVFKKSSLEQALKQAELDVIGINNEKLYLIEVAFHENGLQYGGRLETKDRVCKKLLRAYLIGLAYFPNYKYEVIFASPKVNPATDETIKEYFAVLNNDFSDDEKVEFKYIANEAFENTILIPTIQATISDSDSSELFLRSVKMLELFDMVNLNKKQTSIIKKEIVSAAPVTGTTNTISSKSISTAALSHPPKIEFFIGGKIVSKSTFNDRLLEHKQAERIWFYFDGTIKKENWNASSFTENSDLMANIKTSATFRKWKAKGIIKVELHM